MKKILLLLFISSFTKAQIIGGPVPSTRSLTINGVSYNLSANRSWSLTAASFSAVPYTGATGSVNLGAQSFSTSGTSTLSTAVINSVVTNSISSNGNNSIYPMPNSSNVNFAKEDSIGRFSITYTNSMLAPFTVLTNTTNTVGSIFTNGSVTLSIDPITLAGGSAVYNGPWISTKTNENLHLAGNVGVPQLTLAKTQSGNNPTILNGNTTYTSSAVLRVNAGGLVNVIECEGTANNLTWYLQKGTNTVNQANKGTATFGSTVITVGQPSLNVIGTGSISSTFTTGGIYNPMAGILGSATNDAATAGNVGEYVSAILAVGSATTFTTTTAMNIMTISLTAGDWDVQANLNFNETTSTVSSRKGGVTSTSATIPVDGSECYNGVQSTVTSEVNTISIPRKRFSLNATTTIYLVGSANFSAGTCAGFGTLTARRIR